ncbi:MAG: T9SS type A sorting domain-containing protein [Bacteroidia bacterium]|nr:T9SS type A sorting domain-containing protein [Bacteroidia bacterium]
MKHLFTSFLFFTGLQIGTAQLTQANHAPANGDLYDTWQCDSTNVSLGASGAGVTWNYSSVATRSSIVNSYSAVTSTNAAYPQANVFLSASPILNGYYKSTATGLEYYGGNVVVGSVAAVLNYSAPLVAANYPMNLNTTTTSVTGGTINITAPLSVSGTFTGTALIYVDASGTLNLPGAATYTDVLRVITSQTVDFVTFVGSGTLTQVNYDYYGGGVKSSLFTISTATAVTSLGTFTQTLVTRYKTPASPPNAIPESGSEAFSYQVFPNPGKDVVEFTTNNSMAVEVVVSDITGKELANYSLENGSYKMNLGAFTNGVYFYTIKSEEGKTLRTGKMLIID